MPDLKLFRPENTALVVVDMQNDYVHEEGAHAKAGAMYYPPVAGVAENITRLVEAARASKALPIFVMTTHDSTTDSEAWLHRKDGVGGPRSYVSATGSWGAEFYGVQPRADDIVVTKHRYSAFVGTRLDLLLRRHRITALALAGVATNTCVECTLRDGLQLDYHVALVSDGSAGTSQEDWEYALKSAARNYGPVCTTDEMVAAWNAG